jgi:hypothetical protein
MDKSMLEFLLPLFYTHEAYFNIEEPPFHTRNNGKQSCFNIICFYYILI